MSNYTKTTDFEAKDSLPTGDSGKIIRGAEFETEFDAIATAITTKADTAGPTFTGTLTFETISDGTIGVTAFVDEDDMSSDSATLVPTQQSVKAYVDSVTTELQAQDLDFQADSGGALNIDLDTETMTFTGGTGIDTTGSGNAVTFDIDSTVTTLTGTQTLTNKTLTAPVISGNLTTDGTIDGRDVATDGAKLDGIEAGATADQTAAEIRTLVESATDSNVFTDADHSKLDGIEASATADQTDAEIRAAVEAATDSNVFTDADHTKLDGIEASADVTDTANVTAAGALMDSEVTNLAQVKAFDSSDYATAAQGSTADSALQNVVEDTTPQLGGDLASNGNDILFADSDKAIFGAGSDLQIYHDGSTSVIKDAGTGELQLQAENNLRFQNLTGSTYAKFTNGAQAELYYGGNLKLATTSTGIDVTGVITTDGMTTSGNVDFGDLDMARFGVGNDLQIFHNGTENYIKSATSDQDLRIQGNDGGNTIDALVFDMSAAGAATFNAGASFGGTVTADDLDVQQAGFTSVLVGSTNASGSMLILDGDSNGDGSGGDYSYVYHNTDGQLELLQNSPSGTDEMLFKTAGNNLRMKIGSGGDISFYEDTGTTAKLFWDSSAESLGIGTTSPNATLDLEDALTGDPKMRLTCPSTGNPAIEFRASDSWQITSKEFDATDGYQLDINYNRNVYNGGLTVSDNGTERFRIDSSGNVGIATSSPLSKLNVKGTQGNWRVDPDSVSNEIQVLSTTVANDGFRDFRLRSNESIFETGGTEAMRIDTSQNLLVGTTSTANIANATPNVVTDQSYGINDTANKVAFQVDRISFDSSNYYVLNASAIGVKLVNGATAWTTQSDETLKENITELTNVLSKVQNLRCVSYNLKSQNSDDVKLGFIAQDWQTDFSQVVNVDPCDGKLGMNYTETIPVLLKAIQEQTEIINDLRARVAQLEGEA